MVRILSATLLLLLVGCATSPSRSISSSGMEDQKFDTYYEQSDIRVLQSESQVVK